VILPAITDDLSTLLMSAAAGEMRATRGRDRSDPRVAVVLASGGYPDTYETGKVIHGLTRPKRCPGSTCFTPAPRGATRIS
jgi:phosphoribosylamine--glycine ligase